MLQYTKTRRCLEAQAVDVPMIPSIEFVERFIERFPL